MRQLHSRQFVVTASGTSPVAFFATRELAPGRYLHFDPDIVVTEAADGVFVGDIPLFSDDVTLQGARKSGGRWACVWPIARQSAMGLLSLYWSQVGDHISVASSSALLALATNAERTALRVGDYRPNWIVAPLSGFVGIHRLFRDQQIDMQSGDLQLDVSNRLHSTGESLDERAAKLERSLKSQLRQASRLGNLKIALTAGYDSRMIFAAALAEGVEFETYTQSEKSLTGADMTIAAKLSSEAGIRHYKIGPGTPNPTAPALWDAHTGGAVRDADRRFLRHGMFDQFTREDIIVRGGMFEIGSANWAPIFPGDDTAAMPDSEEFGRLITRAFRLLPLTKAFVLPAMHEWRKFRLGSETSIGWRDHLFTDQRCAGWLAGIEQGLGLLEPRSLQLADTSEVVELMTWEPSDPDHAQGRKVQERTIALCDATLLDVPFNPPKKTNRARTISTNLSNIARGDARTAIAMLQSRLSR